MPHPFLYKRGLDRHPARQLHGCSRPFADDAFRNTPRGYRYGRPQKKNFAVSPRHAPLG